MEKRRPIENNRQIRNRRRDKTGDRMLVIFSIIFVAILLFPFLMACFVKYDDGRETSLIVRNDNVKNPRYFSKSFKGKIKEALADRTSEWYVKLSKAEEILVWKRNAKYDKKLDKLIVITDDTEIDDKNTFLKEIYAKDNVKFGVKNKIRALAGDKDVRLGEKTTIYRWVDAEETLVAEKFSKLGVSATAGERLIVEPQCQFGRLFAPRVEIKNSILMVQETDKEEVIVNRIAPLYKKIQRDIECVEDGEELRKTVITRKKFVVGAGAVIYGDIKSDQTVHIKKGAIVTGNVFAENAIVIEDGARVFGNVFGNENVYIGPNVRIGITGRIKSVVSREDMVIAEGAVIFGYIGTEKKGKTVKAEDFALEVKDHENIKIEDVKVEPAIVFRRIHCELDGNGYVHLESREEFEDIDYYGFRENDKLKGMVIPDGVTIVNPSMFYGCENLEYVRIPNSVKVIGEYAFYSCTRLKKVEFEQETELERIGEYAFSECASLMSMHLPKVSKIENAAFRNDVNLEEITVYPGQDGLDCSALAVHHCDNLKVNGLAPYMHSKQ